MIVQEAIDEISVAYAKPMSPLIPRPALMLLGAIASSIYLLEHAVWAEVQPEFANNLDAEVFRRWVIEGGMEGAIQAVKRAKVNAGARAALNSALVFGSRRTSKL